MLNPFPTLLAFSLFAPLLLRIVVGCTFIHFGTKNLKLKDYKRALGYIEMIGGLLLIIGLFTQIVALIFTIYLGLLLIDKMHKKNFLTDGVNYYLILFVICLSLIITGAGFLAIDLPL